MLEKADAAKMAEKADAEMAEKADVAMKKGDVGDITPGIPKYPCLYD
jgi:hypothetical protein